MQRVASAAAVIGLSGYTWLRFRDATLTFFFLDDFWVMRDAANTRIRSVWDVGQFFRFAHPGFSLYRPLSTTVYAYVLHALFGYDSSGYHAFQVLIFALNVALAFAITRRLTQSTRAALAVGLVYMLAPGQAVAAYWLSAFTVTGTVSWLLLMMWSYVALSSGWRVFACTLFQIAGLLASEHAVAGPLLLGVLAALRREPLRRGAGALAPAAIIVTAYLCAKVWYFTHVRTFFASAYALSFDPHQLVQNLGRYFAACFNVLTSWQFGATAQFLIGIALLVILLLTVWRALAGSEGARLIAAGVAIFAVSLGPVVALRAHFYDHYVNLAAFGAAVAMLGACRLLTRHWQSLVLVVAAGLLVFDLTTRERVWRQDDVFRLVVNGSRSSAVMVEAVIEAGRQEGVTEVLVPANPVTGSIFANGQIQTYFPSMPRVGRYNVAKPLALSKGQVVAGRDRSLDPSPFGVDHPAPGWDRRFDWLRRLGGGSDADLMRRVGERKK